MDIDFKKVHEEAHEKIHKALTLFLLKNGDYHGACGFAWVKVLGVRKNSKLGKQLIELGFYKSDYEKALVLWNPGGLSTQCVETKCVAASAYAETLRSHGLVAYAQSRLD